MSQVIGFRLDEENPREAQALAILAAQQEQGYSTRHILTEALLRLDHGSSDEAFTAINELQTVLERAYCLLEQLQNGERLAPVQVGREMPQTVLADSFKRSVKQAARQGMTLE